MQDSFNISFNIIKQNSRFKKININVKKRKNNWKFIIHVELNKLQLIIILIRRSIKYCLIKFKVTLLYKLKLKDY